MQDTHGFEIAIIGMAGRFPGADDVETYWRNIESGVESVRGLRDDELTAEGLSAMAADPRYVRRGGYLEDITGFDASLFGYTPNEARSIDPQHRLFLETAWQALEHAGCAPDQFGGAIGVFAGATQSSYLISILRRNPYDSLQTRVVDDLIRENATDMLPTRVSYKLNLRGPSVVVASACSTSLVATHVACQSLLAGDCDVALAGGVRLGVPHKSGYLHLDGGIMSRDGRCRTFDASASGTVGGSGVGVVVLRRLQDALQSGDSIYAIIKGSAVNNDGARKVGYTAPSVDGQVEVVRRALTAAGVSAGSIGYVEAHGTATRLGDPIEIDALTKAYRDFGAERQACVVGSVKANIGHLDAAAGVASLIKATQMLRYKTLPPSVNYEAPNPEIPFEGSPFIVSKDRRIWQSPSVRRAAVNSLGIGGTNAHVVLEESQFSIDTTPSRSAQLLCFSGKTERALQKNIANFRAWLESSNERDFPDAAYTLNTGRIMLDYRSSFVCANKADALVALQGDGQVPVAARRGSRRLVFMFSGQGSQYLGMLRGLYDAENVFREAVDRCALVLAPRLGVDLRSVLYGGSGDREAEQSRLDRTRCAQPALFVVEYALAKLLASWGVVPEACIGHSIGEYAAACVAGVFTLEDALSIVAARAMAMDAMQPGAMIAVQLSSAEVTSYLGPDTCIAASNAPDLTVVAGTFAAVGALEERLAAADISVKRLRTSHAFHSPMMDPCLNTFARAFSNIELRAPTIPFISNVSGDWIRVEQATSPRYWTSHLRETVAFSAGVRRLLEDDSTVLVEVGPGSTLATLAALHARSERKSQIFAMAHQRGESDTEAVLRGLGRLWSLGIDMAWAKFYHHERRRKIALPTYAFERQRYWLDTSLRPGCAQTDRGASPSGQRLEMARWFHRVSWRLSEQTQRTRSGAGKTWLVFLDPLGIGKRLAVCLARCGSKVWTVRHARGFREYGNRQIGIDPTRRADYSKLFELLAREQAVASGIVNCWSVTRGGRRGSSAYDEYEGLLHTARALPASNTGEKVELYVLSNGLYGILDSDVIDPAKSLLIGPCLVIPKEFGHIRCKSIDVALGRSRLVRASHAIDLDAVLSELCCDEMEPFVALRGKQRFVCSLEPAHVAPVSSARDVKDTSAAELLGDSGSGIVVGSNSQCNKTSARHCADAAGSFRKHGVYLITGAFGGIGSTVARFLGERYQAKLVLNSRGELPPEGEWPQWLQTHHASNAKSMRIRFVQELARLGVDAEVFAADVADRTSMKEGLGRAERRFGPIHGVVHCAGISDGALIRRRTPDDSVRVFQSKVAGTLVLEWLLRHRKLDFFVLCSSLASWIGPVGQVAYCSANAFQNAFARSRAARHEPSTRYVSIAWDAWKSVGMAARTHEHGSHADGKANGIEHGLDPGEGVEVLFRTLAGAGSEYFISTRGWPLPAPMTTEADAEPCERADTDRERGLYPRPQLGVSFVAPRSDIESRIALIWQDRIGIGPLGVLDDFFELNGHSLLAVQIVAEIKRQLQVALPAAVIYERPTIAQLAEYVVGKMPADWSGQPTVGA